MTVGVSVPLDEDGVQLGMGFLEKIVRILYEYRQIIKEKI